jgi:Zn-dependent M16 (insulinase) family peptidase
MGDQFEMSGDFRGAVINIKSTLKNVQQSIGDIPSGDDASKEDLKKLIQSLENTLEKAPQDKTEQAQAVAETAQALVEQAKKEKPNKTILQITGEGLKQAAQNLVEVMPAVVTIASQIVLAVGKLTGNSM